MKRRDWIDWLGSWLVAATQGAIVALWGAPTWVIYVTIMGFFTLYRLHDAIKANGRAQR